MSNDLNRLTRGVRQMQDLYFRIGETMAHVQGQVRTDLPSQLKGIKVGGRGRVLHLLHATQMSVAPGTEVGAYVVHYDDGSIERIPLVYGRDIVDWWSSQRPGLQDAPTGACCLDGIKRHDRAGPGIQDPSCCSDLDQPSSRQENRDPRRCLRQYALRPFLVAATLERSE